MRVLRAIALSLLALHCGALGSSDLDDDECVYPGTCAPPDDSTFSRVAPLTPRHQWPDSGGFCGSLSIQSILLTYGAWVSQEVVRRSTSDGGGHGNPIQGYEILHTNIEEAITTLGFNYIAFNYTQYESPQSAIYLSWLKQQLLNGYPVVWFIMCQGDDHDTYGIAEYDHIEPVWGIYSNHSLEDTTVYPDDVLVHGSDYAPDGAANLGYFRRFDSLVDTTAMDGNCSDAQGVYTKNEAYPCVMDDIDYGYAITGPIVDSIPHFPIQLSVNSIDEPDTREDEPPANFTATLTVNDLTPGASYSVFRFDNYRTVPASSADYPSRAVEVIDFTSEFEDYEFVDPLPILSSSSVYYRCIEA